MPFGDGTGPRGMGPMTGRQAGYCSGFGRPGFTNQIPRRGWLGLGWGRLSGYAYAAPYPAWPRWGGRHWATPYRYAWW